MKPKIVEVFRVIWFSTITAVVIGLVVELHSLRKTSLACDHIIVDGYRADDRRIMRRVGYSKKSNQHCLCKECGLAVWDEVPESQLGAGDICGECRTKN